MTRKLAEMYYRVLRYGLTYAEQGLRVYERKYTESQRRLLAKLAAKQGFKLVAAQLQPLPSQATRKKHLPHPDGPGLMGMANERVGFSYDSRKSLNILVFSHLR